MKKFFKAYVLSFCRYPILLSLFWAAVLYFGLIVIIFPISELKTRLLDLGYLLPAVAACIIHALIMIIITRKSITKLPTEYNGIDPRKKFLLYLLLGDENLSLIHI